MNTNVASICEVVENVKEDITNSQYKTIMDNLMVLNNKKEETIIKESIIDNILDQIEFCYQYIPRIGDVIIRSQFSSRLDLLKKTVYDLMLIYIIINVVS